MTEAECRRIVTERSRGICEHCVIARATNMSHRKARGQGGEWTPENVVHSCGSGTTGCHGWVESNPTMAHELGWRVWSHEDPAKVPFLLGGVAPMLLTRDGRRVLAFQGEEV